MNAIPLWEAMGLPPTPMPVIGAREVHPLGDDPRALNDGKVVRYFSITDHGRANEFHGRDSFPKILAFLRTVQDAHYVGLEECTGLSRSAIRAAMKFLVANGFVEIEERVRGCSDTPARKDGE